MKSTTVRSALDLRKFGSAHSGSYLMNHTDPQQAALMVAAQLAKTLYIDQSGGPGGTYGVLVGARNSINKDYTVSQSSYAHGSLAVFLNGQFLTPGATEDWIEIDPTLGTFQMVVAPDSDDVLTAMYGETITGSPGITYTWILTDIITGGVGGPRLPKLRDAIRINAFIVGGTSVTFNIEERAVIGAAGTDLMGSDMVATTAGVSTIVFTNASLASGNWLWIHISAVVGTVSQLVITLEVA